MGWERKQQQKQNRSERATMRLGGSSSTDCAVYRKGSRAKLFETECSANQKAALPARLSLCPMGIREGKPQPDSTGLYSNDRWREEEWI